ncbi:fatty acid hydroxylase domain-containing protein 2-like isoform X1 [Argiope bruennichi]|uniref:fatty acid hydroxylase domain-containing protein 2-like isoform X1 n=2 Tax=Argiope bruennichi TaxID=94029 RepID=UPI002493F93D|nr:fatty acid hydroxylase domain-containing protein 2-like isoform X1 [Argiope bruennichi]
MADMEAWEAFEKWENEVWFSLYKYCNGNEVFLNVIIPLIILLSVYWSVGALFTLVDFTGKPHFIIKYKIPDPTITKYPRITEPRFRAVATQVLFNQTVVTIPVIYFCYMLRNYLGYDRAIKLPKPNIFVFNIIAQVLVEEVFFYYSHRILHHPRLYKHYHKRHHEWISPVGVSAIYCHPVEHVLSNVLPTFMGSVIAGTHVTSLWAWLIFATGYGVIVHSGYHLPLTPTPEFHHYHHLKFKENFGIIGILDWLHGTDKEFRKSEFHKRNVVLFSLTSLNEQHSEISKQVNGSLINDKQQLFEQANGSSINGKRQ